MPTRLLAGIPLLTSLMAAGCLLPPQGASQSSSTQAVLPAGPRFAEALTSPGQRVSTYTGPERVETSPIEQPVIDLTAAPTRTATTIDRVPMEPPEGSIQAPHIPPAPNTTTQPVAAVSPLLSAEPVYHPSASESPLVAAVRAYLNDRPQDAAQHLQSFSRGNQELLQILLPTICAARHVDLTGRDQAQAGIMAKNLVAAMEIVADAAPMTVRKAVFVDKIKQFGDFHPLPPEHRFLPGGKLALLYVELENAPSNPTPLPTGGSGYVTRLEGIARITDAAGRIVDQPDRLPRKSTPFVRFDWNEYTRSRVRDVYGTYEFPLPTRSGKYNLHLELRDPVTGRTTQTSVSFVVSD